jgi:hypothetical protein
MTERGRLKRWSKSTFVLSQGLQVPASESNAMKKVKVHLPTNNEIHNSSALSLTSLLSPTFFLNYHHHNGSTSMDDEKFIKGDYA